MHWHPGICVKICLLTWGKNTVEQLITVRFGNLAVKHLVIASAVMFSALSNQYALAGEITIYRDNWGVPHIYAASESDGFYGLGYAQAQDRLWKLLEGIHWARGSLASIDGAGQQGAHLDLEASRWRHLEEAQSGLGRLSPQLRRNYQAFINGVNAYMGEHQERVPDWAPTIEVVDVVALTRAFTWGMYQSGEGMADCQRGEIDVAPLMNAPTEQGASNGWVLSPRKTSSGAVILAADPHSDVASGVYYEYHIDAGDFRSAGFALGPLLWQAHNGQVGWAMTTGAPDVVDCFEVDVDPENPNRFRFDGQWQTFEQRSVTLSVAGGKDIITSHEYSHHNNVLSPVVARIANKAYVVSSAYMHQAGVFDEEIYQMNLANNVDEVKKAMRGLGMFPQNLIIGDKQGNISYVRAGRTPIRPQGIDYSRPVNGNTSRGAWKGIHAFDDLIQVSNPPNGYLQNNNVAPDRLVAQGNPVSAHDYPQYLFNDNPGRITTRGLRTLEFIESHASLSLEQVIQLTVDEKWINTAAWQRALRFAVNANQSLLRSKSAQYKQVLQRLLDFDGIARADSVAALNFYHWRENMWSYLKAHQFNKLRHFPWQEKDFSPAFTQYLLDKVEISMKRMRDLYGSTEVSLGQTFRLGREGHTEPLGGATIEEPGIALCVADQSPFCERTMRAFSSTPPNEQGYRLATRGSQSTRVIVFSDPVKTYTAHAYGQSYVPRSSHYNDQTRLFSEKRLKRVYFDRESVVKNSRSAVLIHSNMKGGER